ncbi:DNA-protecting protein DprA [Patescibacteria group bacterium]|nr:DNA-protecting protein DprA [Patescibacteria group bacterium]
MTNVITKENPKYPALLQEIPDAPKQLYYKGEWPASPNQGGRDDLFENCLAVVGTRRMTSYGKRVCEQVVGEIAAAGVTIVSGFMYGIDATAHRAALKVGGKTIAVMPCGIERIHPGNQEDLYEELVQTSLVVSEWEGDMMPALWTYPKRNRIVAGLSKATLVIEAGIPSGSLITADLALQYERKLFAVPGPITSSVSKGTTQLLKQGATLVSCSKDVLEYYGVNFQFSRTNFQSNPNDKISKTDTSVERKILETLQRESLEVDVLARTLEIPAAELGTTLSFMEIQGIIKQDGGKYYVN